jgi:hypothetical protein
MKGDKDLYLREAEKLVEDEGFSPADTRNLDSFLVSTAGRKLLGTMAIEAKNNIMQMANIDFRSPTAPVEAQALRFSALALNSFIDTIFALTEEEEKADEDS